VMCWWCVCYKHISIAWDAGRPIRVFGCVLETESILVRNAIVSAAMNHSILLYCRVMWMNFVTYDQDLRMLVGPYLGDPRTSIEVQLPSSFEFQCHRFIDQVIYPFEVQLFIPIFWLSAFRIKIVVMVPSYNDLLFMRQSSNPINLRLYICRKSRAGKVTGMDENITVWNWEGV